MSSLKVSLIDLNDYNVFYYFLKGTKDGHSKQKMPKKSKGTETIKPPSSESPEKDQNSTNSAKKETDLVERIALDLDQLDLDETVEKVQKELSEDLDLGLVQALASGADVKPSEDGKYPHQDAKESPKAIKIPQVHFEVKKTAVERHRFGQMSPLIYQLLTKGNSFCLHFNQITSIRHWYQNKAFRSIQ